MEGLPKTFDQRIKDLKGGETLEDVHLERNKAAVDYQNKIDEINNLNIKGDLKDELSQVAHNETLSHPNEKIQEFRDKGLELSDLDALQSRREMILLEKDRFQKKIDDFVKKEIFEKDDMSKRMVKFVDDLKKINTEDEITLSSLIKRDILKDDDVLLSDTNLVNHFSFNPISNVNLIEQAMKGTPFLRQLF